MTNKKDLSERDICTKYITPALELAGWDMHKQVREEVSFTDGRIYVKGNLSVRGKRKRADYILYYKPNIPIAIIEAKDNSYSVKAGIQHREFSRDFFDLIVIDECHRGSASEDSAWREILDYFSSATHVGLTATPRETETISSTEYFGNPIYTYSLKQGIQDGFLAPYKVVRVGLNVDLEGWRPDVGKTDKNGQLVEDRIYNRKDFDRNLVIDERTQKVANRVTAFLKKTCRFDKTIVFCVDIDHAQRMRAALANANSDLMAQNPKYIMQITGDNDEGKRELDNFINPEEKYPVIATTSKLMTTGVDAQTCKLIVLDSNIGSMTEFKQIIGRGTRINEEFGKSFFTILDFRNITDLFADPAFDGDPVRVKEVDQEDEFDTPESELNDDEIITDEEGDEIIFPTPNGEPDIIDGGEIISEPQPKYYVNGVNVAVLNERIQYMDANGKLITGSLKDYTRQKVPEHYQSLDEFLNKWNSADKKQAIIDELIEQGIVYENLKEAIGKEMDIFDMICHTAFDRPPLTRSERANQVKKRDVFTAYDEQAKKVLEALLDKYAAEGIENIEDMKILQVNPLTQLGSPVEIVNFFGGKKQYLKALSELEQEIYKAA